MRRRLSYPDRYRYADSDGNSNGDAYTNSNRNGDAYVNSNPEVDAHAQISAHAEGSSHSSTAALKMKERVVDRF